MNTIDYTTLSILQKEYPNNFIKSLKTKQLCRLKSQN